MLFIAFIQVLFFLMHFYVLWRLFGLFGCRRRWGFWILTLVASTALIGSRIAEAYIDHIAIEMFFVAAGYGLGLVWLLFSVLLVYEVVKYLVPHKPRTAGIAIITVVCVLAAYATVNARRITVNTFAVPGPAPLRIVQLSDIHIGSMNAAFIQRMVDKTNALQPDKILITGDLIDHLSTRTRAAMTLLADLEAPTYFVSGNHEFYAGRREIINLLDQVGIETLDNRFIRRGPIQLIGLPDTPDLSHAESALLAMPYDRHLYSILMFHRPIDIEFLNQAGIDLTLVGHTHGGQIFPFHFLARFFERPLYGLHQYGDSFLYVCSGTGLWGPRMRLGSNNEIALIELTPPQTQ